MPTTFNVYNEKYGPKEVVPERNKITSQIIYDEFLSVEHVMHEFMHNDNSVIAIQEASYLLIESVRHGHKILSCGNGGSYSDAQHFASELSGKYRGVRPAIAALALSDGGAMSCIANDFGYASVFSRQVEAIGRHGDCLLALSTSGNSDNIIRAAQAAQKAGIKVISICGNGGGKLKEHSDVLIEIPHSGSADRIQECTIIVIHILVSLIEKGIA